MHDLPRGCRRTTAPTRGPWPTCLPPESGVGAPPDNFTPRGQDWDSRRGALTASSTTGYAGAAGHAACRAGLTPTGCASTMSPGCGGCGGFRPGTARTAAPTSTTTPTSMLAVLALEAYKAQAIVVGEDLGTVEPEVTEALADNDNAGLRGFLVHSRRVRTRRTATAAGEVALASGRQPVHPRPSPPPQVFCAANMCGRAQNSAYSFDVPAEQAAAEQGT